MNANLGDLLDALCADATLACFFRGDCGFLH